MLFTCDGEFHRRHRSDPYIFEFDIIDMEEMKISRKQEYE
jgi:hypothetical protein